MGGLGGAWTRPYLWCWNQSISQTTPRPRQPQPPHITPSQSLSAVSEVFPPRPNANFKTLTCNDVSAVSHPETHRIRTHDIKNKSKTHEAAHTCWCVHFCWLRTPNLVCTQLWDRFIFTNKKKRWVWLQIWQLAQVERGHTQTHNRCITSAELTCIFCMTQSCNEKL